MADTDSPVSHTVYPVSNYRPDNGFETAGIVQLLGALAITGALLGLIADYISQWFYLVILFPVGIGIALGFVGGKVIHQSKIRNASLAALAGLLGGLFAMFVMHYSSYYRFAKQFETLDPQLKTYLEDTPEAKATFMQSLGDEDSVAFKEMDDAYEASRSFITYIEYLAHEGVSISNHGRKGINLGYWGTYIYWLIEIGIVAGIAFITLRKQARFPYCGRCHNWKALEILGNFGGEKPKTLDVLKSGRVSEFTSCDPQPAAPTGLVLTMASCSKCREMVPADLMLESVTLNRKKERKQKELTSVTYPGLAMKDLRSVFTFPTKPPVS